MRRAPRVRITPHISNDQHGKHRQEDRPNNSDDHNIADRLENPFNIHHINVGEWCDNTRRPTMIAPTRQ